MNERLLQQLVSEALQLLDAKRSARASTVRAVVLNQIRALHGAAIADAVASRICDGQKKSRSA